MKPNLYEYQDYRKFLRDAYSYLKTARRGVSHRSLSKKAGFKSPNFLQMVMNGKRNLSTSSLSSVARAFGLTKPETAFFENLVLFNQSDTTEDKAKYFERMTKSGEFRAIQQLEIEKFEYFSKWYYPAVREMTLLENFREDPVWISSRLEPEITVREALKALEILQDLKLIKRNSAGRLVPSDISVSSGAEAHSVAVRAFHQQVGKMGVESIDRFPPSERDVSGLIFPIPASQVTEIKEKIQQFRKEILQLVEEKDSSDRIYYLGINFFPASKKKGRH